ncbi:MAG TPA: tRNA pseudouridine(13) synthase TruD, partial [Phycisphaerae bacterium]|nr:tRNA pseudouridine(13) synthase TruD [Phycisphaerae bacterium]
MHEDIFAGWPCLTRDFAGIGGEIKVHPDDFRVDEIPAYMPCGEGTHVFVRAEKRGMTTPAATGRLAKILGINPADVGYAGLKDARAVTTQYFSMEHVDEKKLCGYDDGQLKVVSISRHGNKLKTGHLLGNRFVIRIRGVSREQLGNARAIFDVLCRRGVPNYFGVQRFGARRDTHLLGEALVRDDRDGFLKKFLGSPQAGDFCDMQAARDSFDAGCLDRALKLWPRQFEDQRKALLMFRKTGRPGLAIGAVDKRMKR